MQNIVINFTGDTGALQTIINALEEIVKKNGDLGVSWVKTSEKIEEFTKKSTTATKDLTKTLEGAATGIKNIDKVIVGAAASGTFKKLSDQTAQWAAMGVQGAKLIQQEIDNLIKKENVLAQTIKNTSDPKTSAELQIGLKQTQEQVLLLTNALQGLKQTGDIFNPLIDSEEKLRTKTEDLGSIFDDAVAKFVGLADSTNTAEIGTGYTKFLKDIQAQLQLTNAEIVKFLNNSKKNLQTSLASSTDTAEQEKLKAALTATTQQIDLFSKKQVQAGASAQNFTTHLRALRNEIESIEKAKIDGTATDQQIAKLEKLTEEYAEVARVQAQFNIKSKGLVANDEVLAGTISLVRGVAGGYAVAEGAAALFGTSNEAVAQTLLKVNAAMAILQGLSELTATIQKSSAGSIFLESVFGEKKAAALKAQKIAQEGANIAQQKNVILTEEQAVVEGATVIKTDALAVSNVALAGSEEVATVATAGLTTALLANPITAVVIGLLALLAAVNAISSADHTATEEIEKQNQALKEATELLDLATQSTNNYANKTIAQETLIGASAVKVSKIRGDAAKVNLQSLNIERDALQKSIEESQAIINSLEKQGKSPDDKLLEGHKKLTEEKLKLDIKYSNDSNALEIQALDHQKLLNEEKLKDFIAFNAARVAATVAGSDNEKTAQIAALRSNAAEREKSADFIALTEGEKAQKRAEDEKQVQGLQLAQYQHYLKGRTAAKDAEIDIEKTKQAKNDAEAIASINKVTDLQIAAIKRQKDEALSNPTLNGDERKKIRADAILAEFEARKKAQIEILNIEKQGIDLRLEAVEKGTLREASLLLDRIENNRKIEIAAAGKNADLIAEINLKADKQRADANKAYHQIELDNAIAFDNAALEDFRLIESEKLPIVLDRLRLQEEKEIEIAGTNAAKLAEINAKYDAARLKARQDAIEKELALNIQAVDLLNEIGNRKRVQIIDSPFSSQGDKQAANDQQRDIENLKIRLELDALEKIKLTLSAEEYHRRLQILQNNQDAINRQHAETDVQIFRDAQQRKLDMIKSALEVVQNGIDQLDASPLKDGLSAVLKLYTDIGAKIAANKAIHADANSTDTQKKQADQDTQDAIVTASIVATQGVLDSIFADSAAKRQEQLNADLKALDEQKAHELDNKKLTEEQKAGINKKYHDKERQLKRDAFFADKAAKVQEAVINGALAVTNALATVHPFPAAIIAAIVAASLAGVQIALIAASPVPKFKHGQVDIKTWNNQYTTSNNSNSNTSNYYKNYSGQIDVRGPGTKTSDSIPALISAHESVINADATLKWKEALKAINENKFEGYLHTKFSEFSFPKIPEFGQNSTTINNFSGVDYEKLGKALAANIKVPAPTIVHTNPVTIENNFDDEGLKRFITKGNSKTEHKNRRYNMRS